MTKLRHVSLAILVGTCGRLLLQQRDDVPGIIHPGLVGLFGGHREAGETALECLLRELHEEIGEAIDPGRAEPFLTLGFTVHGSGEAVDLALYVVRDIPIERLVVTEGMPLVTEMSGLPALYHRMSPSTAFALREFVLHAEGDGSAARRAAEAAQQQ